MLREMTKIVVRVGPQNGMLVLGDDNLIAEAMRVLSGCTRYSVSIDTTGMGRTLRAEILTTPGRDAVAVSAEIAKLLLFAGNLAWTEESKVLVFVPDKDDVT